jgi:uncharacterized protein YkwD
MRCWLPLLGLWMGCAPGEDLEVLPMGGPLDQAAPPPELAVSPMLPGHPATLTATDADPNARVYFVWGNAAGAGPCPPQLSGGCLDVDGARLLGSARADATGTAVLEFDVAISEAIGTPMVFQAVVLAPTVRLGTVLASEVSDPFDLCPSGTGAWPSADEVAECEMLQLINDVRAQGATCGNAFKPPTTPLSMDGFLRDAARVHAEWMRTTGNFGHASPGGPLGDTIGQRVTNAGYDYRRVGENVLRGQNQPANALARWLASTTHCNNLMDSRYIDVGYGRSMGTTGQTHWTAVFARPAN